MTDKYKVVFIPELGDPAQFEKEYNSRRDAELALNAISEYTLMLHECGMMADYSNFGLVMEFNGADWLEIDGDGNEHD